MPADKARDASVLKKLEKTSRFLIAGVDEISRFVISESVNSFVGAAEYSFAADGTDALFKLSNVDFQIVFFAKNLQKRSGMQVTEWLAAHNKLEHTAVILLCDVPDSEKFVDDVVIGRVQFVPDLANKAQLDQAISRALNYVTHGDQSSFHLRFLTAGEVLMRQGEAADNVYLVKKGRLRAVLKANGKEQILGYVEVGEFVGEMAYINGEPRLADVAAETPSELIEIPIAQLDHILFQKPAWSKALMKTLSKRLKVRDLSGKP